MTTNVSEVIDYHLSELKFIRDPSNPKRFVPSYPCAGWTVLDVGCGIGQTLSAQEFSEAAELHGIDVYDWLIAEGQALHPHMKLTQARAEQVPYPREYFDLVYSRVALPYTNIPLALREMHRVLRPSGHLWLTLHTWTTEAGQWKRALRDREPKRIVDRSYVALNSVLFWLTGHCIRKPWKRTPLYESVQTIGGIRRALSRAGFGGIKISLSEYHFLVQAVRK